MSYLDVPRIHFAGEFTADVATRNNVVANHDNSVSPMDDLWNPNGTGRFGLRNCVVTGVTNNQGALITASAADHLIGGPVSASFARLVDLDPEHQTGSQIWGLGLTIAATGAESLAGTMTTAALRELWSARSPGGMRGFGASYQTVLTSVVWSPVTAPLRSIALNALFPATTLSLKLVLYAYDPRAGQPGFGAGRVVGTVGPVTAGEPAHCLVARKLVFEAPPGPAAPPPAFNAAPFKLDSVRRRLVVDLGNSLPEASPGGGRRPLRTLRAEIVHPAGAPESLGTIPNDIARYLTNAGIEELAVTTRQAADLATRRLRLREGTTPILAERANGILADVTESVVRLNPTAPPASPVNRTLPGNTVDVEIVVTQFGRPMPNATVLLNVLASRGLSPQGLSLRTAAGPIPAPLSVVCGPNGRARLTLVAGDPGHPRPELDGQVFFVGVFVGSVTSANRHAQIAVRVFDRHPLPATPTFAGVQPILLQYARLYPSMTRVIDMRVEATVRATASALLAAIQRDLTNPSYMPVTRDLSADKTELLAAYFRSVIPRP